MTRCKFLPLLLVAAAALAQPAIAQETGTTTPGTFSFGPPLRGNAVFAYEFSERVKTVVRDTKGEVRDSTERNIRHEGIGFPCRDMCLCNDASIGVHNHRDACRFSLDDCNAILDRAQDNLCALFQAEAGTERFKGGNGDNLRAILSLCARGFCEIDIVADDGGEATNLGLPDGIDSR